ncbi:MAG: hypothetical protein AABZ02_10810 [Bacteroidota bacterium]
MSSGGAINQTGDKTIKVSGLAEFTSEGAGPNGKITLGNANKFGSLKLTSAKGDRLTINEADSTLFDAVAIDSGAFTVSSGGDITQVANTSITVEKTADFTVPAANSVKLDNTRPGSPVILNTGIGQVTVGVEAANTFKGPVYFNRNTGRKLKNVAISDTTDFELSEDLSLSGTLTIIAIESISQKGLIKVTDLETTSTQGEIVLLLDNTILNAVANNTAGTLGQARQFKIKDVKSAQTFTEHGILQVNELLRRLSAVLAPEVRPSEAKPVESEPAPVPPIDEAGYLTRSANVYLEGW